MPSLGHLAFGLLTSFAAIASAHPGHDVAIEAAERAEFMKRNTESITVKCGAQLAARGIEQKTRARRQALAQKLRKRHSIPEGPYLKARDVGSVLATNHHSNLTGITLSTPEHTFFDNSSCLLQPEATQGPYWVSGEYVRHNIIEDQEGVQLTLDVQVVDTKNCEVVPDTYVEFWHCNSTGVYSGVIAGGNGNSGDPTNINNTFLRGIQPTDALGIVRMDTLFPGHYTGRTPHIHIMTHNGGSVLKNSTFTGGNVTHVGQLFFDQDLITEVEKVQPYSSSTQSLTLNKDDMILAGEASTMDPLVEYVMLGDSVADGLYGWITVGIDTGNSFTPGAAATLTDKGGVPPANPNGGMGGPPSGGNGTRPTGMPSGMPSGTPTGTPPA